MSIRQPADDDLDRLLSEAEWPQRQSPETTEAVERLSRAWQELRHAEPVHRSRRISLEWISVGAIAAAVTVLATGILWRGLSYREPAAGPNPADVARSAQSNKALAVEEHAPAKLPAPPRQAADRQPTNEQIAESELAANSTPAPAERAEQLVREPNAYERLVLRTRARAQQARVPAMIAEYQAEREVATGVEARGVSADELALDRLLTSRSPLAAARFLTLVAEPTSQTAALAALKRAENPPIDNLAAFLDDPRRPVRLAAAHALSTLDNPRAVERLSQSVGGIGRQEALMALLASRSQRASQLVEAARRDVYLMASVRAAEQQLLTLQTENGENLP